MHRSNFNSIPDHKYEQTTGSPFEECEVSPDFEASSFTEEWWRQILSETHDLTTARTFRNCIDASDVAQMEEGVVEALRTKFAQRSGMEDVRIYIGNELISETFLEKLFERPPSETEPLGSFIERSFDGRFCIILNKGERYSERLSRQVSEKIDPLFSLTGTPALGADITIFIGNYGWTPLGIHRDKPGENVFHFHLGPAPKTIYSWTDDTYQELAGGEQNNTDIDPLLPHANAHTQHAADMFFMPWNMFHIGQSNELSVTVTVWLNNAPREKYVKTLVSEYLRRSLEDDQLLTPADLVELRRGEAGDRASRLLGVDEDLLDLSLRDLIMRSDSELALSLESNGGWQSLPLTLTEATGRKPATGAKLRGQTVRLAKPFRIVHETSGDRLTLFVRGRKLELRYLPQIVSLIEMLNKGHHVVVEDLLATTCAEIPEEDALFLISLLIDKRGLDILDA